MQCHHAEAPSVELLAAPDSPKDELLYPRTRGIRPAT